MLHVYPFWHSYLPKRFTQVLQGYIHDEDDIRNSFLIYPCVVSCLLTRNSLFSRLSHLCVDGMILLLSASRSFQGIAEVYHGIVDLLIYLRSCFPGCQLCLENAQFYSDCPHPSRVKSLQCFSTCHRMASFKFSPMFRSQSVTVDKFMPNFQLYVLWLAAPPGFFIPRYGIL